MGHLVRSLALAQMLKPYFDIQFLLNEYNSEIANIIISEGLECFYIDDQYTEDRFISNTDIVILDGYGFKSDYQKGIKQNGKKLVCIDDIHAFHFYADIIINVSDSVSKDDYSAEPYTRYLLGGQYALLRNIFLASGRKPGRTIGFINEVFISMGGADTNNISLKVLSVLLQISSIEKIHVVIGAVNTHAQCLENYINTNPSSKTVTLHKNVDARKLNSLITNCQLAICPGSGISLEVASIGLGIVSGYTANNQLGILNGLVKRGCVIDIGDFNKLSPDEIKYSIEEYISNLDVVNEMVKNQKRLIDGLSSERFISIFRELC